MNEKEFNLAILAELKRIANEVFAKVKVSKEGTYTAAELWNGKNSMGEKIEIFYMGTSSNVYTAKVDTFSFQVSAEDVFLRLWKFERLCKIRQADKARFTYGEAEHEIVNEKAMYYTGSMERGNYDDETHRFPVISNGNYKVVTKKTTLKKISPKLAEDKKGRPYYKVGGMWYLINDRELSEQTIERLKNEPDYLFGLLEKYDFSYEWELTAIYKALYEAMKSERVNNTPEQRKCENEAKNAAICDRTGESADNEGNLPKTQVASATGYNLLPFYFRQKVFQTEPFYARRKISRFRPLYFVACANYHFGKENALERKINGNTSVYRVLIRGETKQ